MRTSILARCSTLAGLAIATACTLAQDGVRRFGLAEPPPKPEGSIRLTTYNVENLFDHVDDPTLGGDLEDIDDAKPLEQVAAVAEAIRRVNPDILALEEIESIEVLTWFRDTYLADLGYTHVASLDSGDPRGIENAVLSRYPLSSPEVWISADLGGVEPARLGAGVNPNAGRPMEMKRSPLKVTVTVDRPGAAYDLTLFVVHHKSGRDYGYMRTAEAKRVVELFRPLVEADARFCVLGDFNSVPGADAHAVYASSGLADTLPGGRTNETTTHASGRSIDHVFVSPGLARDLEGKAFVLGTLDRPEGADWRTTPPPAGYASDHYPVSVDIIPGR